MPSTGCRDFFDVFLYKVPVVPEVQTNFWRHLSADERRALRLSCRKGRKLGDALITSLTPSVHAFSDGRSSAVEGAPPEHTATAGQVALRRCLSFTRRLPHLTSLTLTSLSAASESGPLAALELLGAATAGRLTSLSLFGCALTADNGLVVSRACPRLQELSTTGVKLALEEAPGPRADRDGACVAAQPLTHPWASLPLRKLDMQACAPLSKQELCTVGTFTSLDHLDIVLDNHLLAPAAQLALSPLAALRHCRIALRRGTCTLVDAAPLLAITALTHLHLPDARHGDDDRWPGDRARPPADAMATALSLLGGLARLQSLHLGHTFVVDDAAFAALRRLTLLTSLHIARMQLSVPPGPGHLPALQILGIQDYLTPTQLRDTLLPLAPLQALRSLPHRPQKYVAGSVVETHLSLNTGVGYEDTGDEDGDMQAVEQACDEAADALLQLSRLLAAAPHLELGEAALRGVWEGGEGTTPHLSLQQLAKGLAPLSGHVHTLRLRGMHLARHQWRFLGAALPGLTTLIVKSATMEGLDLSAHLKALRRLRVTDCFGVRDASFG